MPMPRLSNWISLALALVFLHVLAPSSNAQTELSGRYICTERKVEGRVTPCESSPLILKKDGHFELRGWEGDYRIKGHWLLLTDSEKRSRAKIAPGHRLIFSYPCGKDSCQATFERRLADLGKTSLS